MRQLLEPFMSIDNFDLVHVSNEGERPRTWGIAGNFLIIVVDIVGNTCDQDENERRAHDETCVRRRPARGQTGSAIGLFASVLSLYASR